MAGFLHSSKPPILNEDINNWNRSITNEEVEIVIKRLTEKKKPGGFTAECY